MKDHRDELLADIAAFFSEPAVELDSFSRWGDWERDVIARLPEPSEAQHLIRERQDSADAENEENSIIQEGFAARLKNLGYVPTHDCVFIPSAVARDWYCSIMDERESAKRVTTILTQRITEKQILRLSICRRNDLGRGFFWSGPSAGLRDDPHCDLLKRKIEQDEQCMRNEERIKAEERIRVEGRKEAESENANSF